MSMSLATKNRALTSVRPDTTVSSLRVFTGAFANGAGSSIRWGRGGSTTSELLVHANVAQLPKMFWSTTSRARLLSWRIKTIREVLVKAVGVTRRPAPNMLEPRLHIRMLDTRRSKCPMRRRLLRRSG